MIFDPGCRDRRGAHWLELMHAAAGLLGQDVGLPRAPFSALTGADRDRLAAVLTAIDGQPGPVAGQPAARSGRPDR